MKAIKITSFKTVEKNATGISEPTALANQITAALREINGKATSHTYTHGYEILDALAFYDAKLEKMLGGKKYLPGAVVYLESGDCVPNAYKYTRIGSRVRCERRSSAWYVTEIKCTDLYKAGGKNSIALTEEQDARAVKILRDGYTTIKNVQ
jgi:hypothetical protein